LLTASLDPASRPWTVFRVGSDLGEKARRRGWIRRFSYLREIRRVYVHADALIGNSRGVVDSLRRLLGAAAPPLHRIPNPRDLGLIERLAAADAAHPWCLETSLPVVMSIGRLVAAKDFETLIRAFALLRERLPARLLILGEGPKRQSLTRLIKRLGLSGVVDLAGFSDNPMASLVRARLFVLSSRFEGSPNALIEALACGTPCVATDCPSGPREILGEGALGPLVPVGNRLALAKAMEQVLRDPPARADLLAAARVYDRDTNALRYAQVLRLLPGSDAGGKAPAID
jgi:glycosyltransferase involved in cell wall biosynthesis